MRTTTTCPKCGFPSSDPEICDACGVIFSKVQPHDLEEPVHEAPQDPYQGALDSSVPSSSGGGAAKIVVLVLVLAALGYGAWSIYQLYLAPPSFVELLKRHQKCLDDAETVFLISTPSEGRSELIQIRAKVAGMKRYFMKLPPPAEENEQRRRSALSEASDLLMQTLVIPPDVLAQQRENRTVASPFDLIKQQLEFAETGTSKPLVLPVAPSVADAGASASGAARNPASALAGLFARARANAAAPGPGARAVPTPDPALDQARAEARRFLPGQRQAAKTQMTANQVVVSDAPAAQIRSLNAEAFDNEVLKSKGVCIVEFAAPWSAASRRISSLVDEAVRDLAGKAKFFRVNVDENRRLVERYDIQTVPQVLVFDNGKFRHKLRGNITRDALRSAAASGN